MRKQSQWFLLFLEKLGFGPSTMHNNGALRLFRTLRRGGQANLFGRIVDSLIVPWLLLQPRRPSYGPSCIMTTRSLPARVPRVAGSSGWRACSLVGGLRFSTDTHGIYLLPDCGLVTLLCLVKYLVVWQ